MSLIPLLGIGVLIGIATLFSTSRRDISWRLVTVGIALQAYLALFIVRTSAVPTLLTVAATLCAIAIVVGALRPVPLLLVGTARFLGLLGVVTAVLFFAWTQSSVFILIGLAPLFFVRGISRDALAVLGCVLAVLCLRVWGMPENFVFLAIAKMGAAVTWLVGFAIEGGDYVFGGMREVSGGFVFAINVGAIILLFGGLMSFLYYVGLIPWMVGLMARGLRRALGVTGPEALAAASNVFVGQTEAPLVIRPYLQTMTRSEIMALMTGGFATIAGSVLGAYVAMFQKVGFTRGPADLIAASVMSAPAAFVFAKIFVPETETPVLSTADEPALDRSAVGVNALDALAGGVTAGLKLAVNVVAMLAVFYALIRILDSSVNWVAAELFNRPGITFTWLYSRAFAPFAFLMGVEWSECVSVGKLLGTKTMFNEFIAYDSLTDMIAKGKLSPRAAVLSTYALCGFANFMSIGIQIAGLSQLAPGRRTDFSRLALRAMIAGAMACQLTACIVALLGEL